MLVSGSVHWDQYQDSGCSPANFSTLPLCFNEFPDNVAGNGSVLNSETLPAASCVFFSSAGKKIFQSSNV